MPLDLLGALNDAASESGLGFNGVCNAIANTDGLDALGALNVANGTTGLDMQGVIKQLIPKVSRTNLVTNPSFETNTTTWGTSGTGTTIARITTDFNVGAACLQVTKAAVTLSGAQVANATKIVISPNTNYTASVYVKVPAGNENCDLRLSMLFFDSGNTQVQSALSPTATITAADGWVRLSVSSKSASNAVGVMSRVTQVSVGTAGQKFLVDAAALEKGSKAGTYFDGSTAGGSWSGTAHASTSSILSLNYSVS